MVAGLQADDTVPIQDLPEAPRDLVLGTAKVLIDATIFNSGNEVLNTRSGEGAQRERRRGSRRSGCEDVNQAQGFRGAKSERPRKPQSTPRGLFISLFGLKEARSQRPEAFFSVSAVGRDPETPRPLPNPNCPIVQVQY